MGRRAYLLHNPNLLLARRRQAGPLLGTLIITRIGFSWLQQQRSMLISVCSRLALRRSCRHPGLAPPIK